MCRKPTCEPRNYAQEALGSRRETPISTHRFVLCRNTVDHDLNRTLGLRSKLHVLISTRDRGFVARKEDFVWQDGIFELVRLATARGFVPVVVTNQSGIGRGLYSLADYEALTAWMLACFEAEGAPIARVYFCPFHPEAEIAEYRAAHPWRKPAPGMLMAAAADLDLELERSILVGDRWSDVGAARAAGLDEVVIVGPLASQPAPSGDGPALRKPLVRCDTIFAIICWLDRRGR